MFPDLKIEIPDHRKSKPRTHMSLKYQSRLQQLSYHLVCTADEMTRNQNFCLPDGQGAH